MAADPHEKPPDYKPPRSAEELLARYAVGERYFVYANLAYTNLAHAELVGVNLEGANLTGVELPGAHLNNADLRGTNLCDSNLFNTSLYGTSFRSANLARANLAGAKLYDANLARANLDGACLDGAHFGGAKLAGTYLANTDISPMCDADPPVVHLGSSIIDHGSIILSASSPHLKDFLVRAGMPAMFAEYNIDCAKALRGSVFDMMRSTFISYGGPDAAFARKLYEALHSNGVTTFLYEEHAIPGEKIHRTMRNGVNEHDRVVLICSKASLVRPGVLAEIEHVLEREARDGGETYLIPIRLDDYVLREWKPKREDLAQAVRDREVANFEGADTDPVKFEKALGRLLRALRKPTTLPKVEP
jgi:hypothetical protein